MNLVLLLLLTPNFRSIPTRFLSQMVFFKVIITLGKSTESIYPTNIKTFELIGLKFCLGPHMTPGKDAQNY